MQYPEWMDRPAIERGKRELRRDSDVGRRTNGPVVHVEGEARKLTPAERVRMHRAWAMARQIDGDFQRGGFAPHMRHAR